MYYDSETIDYINSNINIIDYISQYTELTRKNNEIWCNCPIHKETEPSFSIDKEKNVFYCFGCFASGGVINFVMGYHKLSFPKAVEHLIEYGNLSVESREKSELMDYLIRINRKKKIDKVIERQYLQDNIMNQYTNKPIDEWLREEISQEILDKYEVRYDDRRNSIVFPIRNENGEILAIKSRTRYENYKDLGLTKYIYYQPIGTNDFLYGLYQNKDYIKHKNECIIFESEKSVMKMNSWNYNNVVASSTKKITIKQTELLLSLHCNLVFALDKDVSEKETIEIIKQLTQFTNVYYVYDNNNLLGSKDAPCDKTKEIWDQLYSERRKLN